MTVETTDRKQTFAGGQGTLTFTFRAAVSRPEDIKMVKTLIATGVETALDYGVDYTVAVSADGVGGVVTVAPSVSTSYTQTVYRDTTDKQESDYEDYNQFPADTLEENLDQLTMKVQELSEVNSRTITLPVSSSIENIELPNPEDSALIGWSGTSGTLVNYPVSAFTGSTGAVGPQGPAGENGVFSEIASQVDAEGGTDNVKGMTPLRTSQAITALQRGIASQLEAEAGTDNTKDMTPLRVAQAITALAGNVKYADARFKSGTFTKAMTDADAATTTITGLGFTPVMLLFFAEQGTYTTPRMSWGVWTADYDGGVIQNGGGNAEISTLSIRLSDSGGSEKQEASSIAVSNGQFIITWGKTGSPTGNSDIVWIAFR
jgi:hypothetical protein